MQIHFNQVVPAPLVETLPQGEDKSEIWDCQCNFDSKQYYQVYAPSGKGKSTFINIIYGLRHDYTGEVSLDDTNVENIKAKEFALMRQSQLSVVFQDLRLFMSLTAWENICVNAVISPQFNEKETKDMAEKLGISHLLHKPASLLSYGERQRVAIVRALAQPFECLLLDEPFSHLDEQNIEKACQLIVEKCKQQQAGLIMTSLGYPYYINFDKKLRL